MPAVHGQYQHRNGEIGCVAVYDISIVRPALARLVVDGKPVEDGTVARVTDAHDFDFPFTYTLGDGRVTRAGGSGWHHYRTTAEAREWHDLNLPEQPKGVGRTDGYGGHLMEGGW